MEVWGAELLHPLILFICRPIGELSEAQKLETLKLGVFEPSRLLLHLNPGA
jgi:hypothetical protein